MISNSYTVKVYDLISKVSGHDVKDLEPDLFLESDFGLDSIKTVELLNSLIELIPPDRQGDFLQAVPMEKLMQLQTLGEIIAIAQDWFESKNTSTENQHNKTVDDEITEESVQLINAQYIFLATHLAVASCSVCSTVRFKGIFDLKLASASWKELLFRHPMLRAYFSIPGDAQSFKDYQLRVLNHPQPPEFTVIDLRDFDAKTQESRIQEIVNEAINETWSLEQWPLHRFFALRLEDFVYEIGFSHHHVLSDGLSNQIVLREFIEIYAAKLNGIQPNLPPLTTVEGYRQPTEKINSWQDSQAETSLQNYLSQQGKNKFFWNPQAQTIPHKNGKFRSLPYQLEQNLTAALIDRARAWRLSLNTLLVGAYLQAIAEIHQQTQSIILNIPTSGRTYPEVDVSQMVGCFAENIALSFPIYNSQNDDLSFLKLVQSEIQTALVSRYDNAQTVMMGNLLREKIKLNDGKLSNMAASLIQTAIKSNLYLSNMGQTHLKTDYQSLKIINYRSATGSIPGGVDTLVEMFDNRLHFSTNYDENCFTASFIDALVKQFIAELKRLALLDTEINSVSKIEAFLPEDSRWVSTLQKVACKICHLSIGEQHFQQDLEADLGLDSLERIRMITELEKQLNQKLDRQGLLSCRSLEEMAQIISLSADDSVSNQADISIPYVAICEQAKRTPNAVAVLEPETPLTYQKLHRLSNQVAHYLRQQGVKPGDLIGIMTQRNSFLWVGILGILKAGAAYVPIDPTYPSERICYMLNHAEIGIVLTESQLTDKIEPCLMSELALRGLVFLDEGAYLANKKPLKQVNRGVWSQELDSDLPLLNTPDDLMVVLYTSGSTGRPKGVMLNHRGYMNRLEWMQKTFMLKPGDRVAQKTSCCFDISIWEIFWPLMVGATVCPVHKDIVKDPWSLAQWLNETQINIMHFVPSLFGEFINALAEEHHEFPHLRWLIFSGEALPIPFIQAWLDQYGTTTGLANLYGPTEASIDVSCHIIRQRPGEQGETSIPIGKAIDNVDLLILDENQKPVPPGELGELWIGGIQLAKGYLKDPERTAKAFCSNPFYHINGKYLYRTGDLAKQLSDGSFEYHGRIDHQVKIRGFRVELGEIESVLLSHPAVNEAAVVVIDLSSGKRLVAGLVSSPVDPRQMKEFLKQRLPDYMIPHRLEWFQSLPKNHNGKLDRKALFAVINGEEIPVPTPTKPIEECLPLGPAQRWLVRYFDAPYQWTGYTRCLYHQPLDLELFNQALNCLIERHWALRTVFLQRQGQWWQQEIHPTEPLKVIYYDGTHLSPEKRDIQMHKTVQEIGQQLRVDSWPLIQVMVIKVNDSCYDINMIGHHIVGDLLSSQVLFRELWFIYTQLLSGQQDVLKDLPTTVSYADYVRYLMAEESQGNLESHIDYWKSQFPSPQSAFQIPLDQQLGTNLETSAVSEWFTLPKEETAFLLSRAKKHYGCNVYSLLLAPLYRLMAQWSGSEQVVLSHRSHSRNLGQNNQFFSSVGNFATNFPLGLAVNNQEEWQTFVKRIKDKFNQLPMNGSTFDWIGEKLPSYLYPDNYLTPVRANYFGNRNVRPSEIFEFIKEDWDRRLSPPEQKRTTLLEFFFCITDDCLELQIEYSRHFHFGETIQKLGQDYLQLLRDLLAEVPNDKLSVSPSQNHQSANDFTTVFTDQSSLPLAGKVAIITGADGEIGRAIALKLASQGAKVAAISQALEHLQDTVTQIQQWGGEAIAISANISDLAAVETALKQVAEQWDGIHILVNNAEITGSALLADSDPAEWRRIVEVNLFGTYNCCRTAIPYLLQKGEGKIINLGSDSSFVGYPVFSADAVSKHGILGLTKSLSEELKQDNIQVNAVCPPGVDSVQTPKTIFDPVIPSEQVAEVVYFLANPAINSITGECLKLFGKQDIFQGSQHLLGLKNNHPNPDKNLSNPQAFFPTK
jgi:amino acid adenylation domain-containing protein